jgi:hypothetical protein
MKIVTETQLRSSKYIGKFLDTYPLHYHTKDKNGNWTTVYELRGVSSKIRENYETVEEILNY